MGHTIRCLPASPGLRLVPLNAGGGSQIPYASGAAVPIVIAVGRAHALHIMCGAPATIVASVDDGGTVVAEVEQGSTVIEFGREVRSLAITSVATGTVQVLQMATMVNP